MGTVIDLGDSIPPATDHAVSVSLPTWRSNIGYEEGEGWVINKMKTGYPRFFIHKSIVALKDAILEKCSSGLPPLTTAKYPGTTTEGAEKSGGLEGKVPASGATPSAATSPTTPASSRYDAVLFPNHTSAARALSFLCRQCQSSSSTTATQIPVGINDEQQLVQWQHQENILILDVIPNSQFSSVAKKGNLPRSTADPSISALVFPKQHFPVVKQFWQHTGEGISSRRAEYVLALFEAGLLEIVSPEPDCGSIQSGSGGAGAGGAPQGDSNSWKTKGPRRYQRSEGSTCGGSGKGTSPVGNTTHTNPTGPPASDPLTSPSYDSVPVDSGRYVEERFGRTLDLSKAEGAKRTLRKRIAAVMNGCTAFSLSTAQAGFTAVTGSSSDAGAANSDAGNGPPPCDESDDSVKIKSKMGVHVSSDDVFLYPCGMNAIFHVHQNLLELDGSRKSIEFGFPYIDTLKLLQKFGPGCVFYGFGSESDLDALESVLESGTERYLALFCEFPSNPLLSTPNLVRISELAHKYDFLVVVDETIGSFFNVDLFPYADVVVSSLTKIFSGDSNVMGGSVVLNPEGRKYATLKSLWAKNYQDSFWPEDALFLERNSRDFFSRAERANANAEAICDLLVKAQPSIIKTVYYPKINPTRSNYDRCRRRPHGRYGTLLSATFKNPKHAPIFYDALDTAKGPSLGTNFTLSSPYVLLAHYGELDWAKGFGVDPDLIRFSVGLERTEDLIKVFQKALDAVAAAAVADACM